MNELAVSLRSVTDTTQDRTARTTVLDVIGPLTHVTAASLRHHLRAALENTSRLLVNLRCCTDIDLDGMLALSVAQHAAQTRGGELRVVDVPPLIERQLRQHNLDELLAEDG